MNPGETIREELLRLMADARDDDLLVWQVKSLRALVMHAEMVARGSTKAGLLDAQYALLYRLVGEVMRRASERETIDGLKKKRGRGWDIAEWEFRVFALGAVDALLSLASGRGALGNARNTVADMATAAGKPIGESYFKNANVLTEKFPMNTPVNIVITQKGIRDMLLKGDAAGNDISDLIREGIELRARVCSLMERDKGKLAPVIE